MRLTIRTRLLGAFAGVLVAMASVGGLGWWQVRTLAADLDRMYQTNVRAGLHLSNTERALWELRFGIGNYLVGSEEQRGKIKAETPKWRRQLEDNLKAYADGDRSDQERQLIATWKDAMAAYFEARPRFFELVDANKMDEAKEFRKEKTNPPAAKAVATLSQLIEMQERAAESRQQAAAVGARRAVTFLLLLIAGAFSFGALAAGVIARGIVKPIAEIVASMRSIAEQRDLTARVKIARNDELGEMAHWFNTMMATVRDSVVEVREAAVRAASASGQLAAAAEQIAAGSQEQASALEQTAASLEEITATVKQNAENAQRANQLASASREVAEKGGSVVGQAVGAMSEINTASRKIADIITTIDEIAFQTNLLALNAAVEAARAGEQGRGFAVVAAEVRNLAQRSAAAAKEIKTLIQDSVGKVDTGSELVNRSGQALQEIVTSVKRVTDIVAEITAASGEQSSGIEQVNRAVTQMDSVVQATAVQTEELSSTAQAMSSNAADLETLVARFKLETRAHALTQRVVSASAAPSPGGEQRNPAPDAAKRARRTAEVAVPPPAAPARRRSDLSASLVPAGARSGSGHAPEAGFEEF